MLHIEEANPSFESCDNCIYSDDSEEMCILRRCIHAVFLLKECYVPKPQTPDAVHCKDCKYYTQHWYCEVWNNTPGFPAVTDEMSCSMAERKNR